MTFGTSSPASEYTANSEQSSELDGHGGDSNFLVSLLFF